jgi:hypothetical protein
MRLSQRPRCSRLLPLGNGTQDAGGLVGWVIGTYTEDYGAAFALYGARRMDPLPAVLCTAPYNTEQQSSARDTETQDTHQTDWAVYGPGQARPS